MHRIEHWSGKVQPTLLDVETSVWCIGRPPVFYVGGWILDDNESRMLYGHHICVVVEEVMVKDLSEVFSHLQSWDVT